jgi:hypothetical protein
MGATALMFHRELKIDGPFSVSQGWLQPIKSRYGIRELDVQAEKLSGDENAATLFFDEFQRIIRYTMDETGLLWKALSKKTFVDYTVKSTLGHKSSKERVTIMACANSTGQHKLSLV